MLSGYYHLAGQALRKKLFNLEIGLSNFKGLYGQLVHALSNQLRDRFMINFG